MPQKLLSIYLQIPKGFNVSKLNYLQWQDWRGCELLVFGEGDDIYNFKQKVGDRLPEESLVYYPDRDVNEVLGNIETDYLTWLNPSEIWNKEFLHQTKDLLSKSSNSASEIVYGIGFIRRDLETDFVAEVYPQLADNNAIHKNFIKPVFLSPFIKYFWRVDLIQSFKLKFEKDDQKQYVTQGLFTIDYFASVYKQRNYTKPDFVSMPLGFLLGDVDTDNKILLKYRRKVLSLRSVWEKNFWQRCYWQSKQLGHIMNRFDN